MAPTALLTSPAAPAPAAPIAAADSELAALFDLNLTVVEETVPVAALRCNTNDGCGSTCSGSACTTSAYDPRD
jgi:FxLD family lantipeptide